MRLLIPIGLLWVLLLGLAGCGQKGPLYFAEPAAEQPATSAEDRDDDEADTTEPQPGS
ncbi:MAG: hypothetical protein CVV10_04575 [Gammaproteobacteria bacterium HGW-Gammaproteobacteria-14]|nr:MAG: hypothetical protein CVV10_04575 [Gammaproteobacteria bacterium HGW-Gammaproteobacteria-14]